MLVVSTQTEVSANLIEPGASELDTTKAIAISVAEVRAAMDACEAAVSSSTAAADIDAYEAAMAAAPGEDSGQASPVSFDEPPVPQDCAATALGDVGELDGRPDSVLAILAANAQTVAAMETLIGDVKALDATVAAALADVDGQTVAVASQPTG
ncbi:hypothetical protein [Demequina aestuarii]|uniref:hypothetical protein n=1 Tax=Demequina aestuarii TaxID=327095 RepID=UPI00187C11D4|nr:hypothetical protein [Demequina aestuarii]